MLYRPVFAVVFVLASVVGVSADPLTDARIAQMEGRFADCAKHADAARRVANNTFHSHRLYANCLVSSADERRPELTNEQYAAEIEKAVAVLQLIARTPGARHETKTNDILEISIQQLAAKAASARAGQ